MKFYFATCDEIPEGIEDDGHLKTRLEQEGHVVETKVWNDPLVRWQDADAVLLRTTWDYHRHLDAFMQWAEEVEKETLLIHSSRMIRWNASKRYLLALQEHGIPIINTTITQDIHEAQKVAKQLLHDHSEFIMKPTISGSAELTYRLRDMESFEQYAQSIIEQSELIIQPFVKSIVEDGEISLMFIGTGSQIQFSHAILKQVQQGDFRVQSDYGGSVQSIEPSDNLKVFGYDALSKAPFKFLYARVDIVDWKTSPKIGELELIEPEMFFRMSPDTSSELFSKGLYHWIKHHE